MIVASCFLSQAELRGVIYRKSGSVGESFRLGKDSLGTDGVMSGQIPVRACHVT